MDSKTINIYLDKTIPESNRGCDGNKTWRCVKDITWVVTEGLLEEVTFESTKEQEERVMGKWEDLREVFQI